MFCIKDLTKSIEVLKRKKKEIVEIFFTLNGVYCSTNKIKSYQKFDVLHQRPDKSNWVVETVMRYV
jgi:sRNA-binding regulator protein Hfq